MSLLEVQGIARAFGGVQALDNVSFAVEEGRIHAVIGPNGAGKTTLFNIISGLLRPHAGRITFAEQDITAMPPHRISCAGIARTFQTLALFENMTVLENVMVGRHIRSRAGAIAAALRLPSQRHEEKCIREAALGHLSSVGLFSKAEAPVSALSFGQRRLVELARALATEPRLLLLDEPASGLNPRETDDLARLIRRVRDSGVTVLLVEHDMSMVMDISDEIVVLHYGRPIASGPPAEIRADPEVVAIYLGGEFTGAVC